jgi:hypothetical protein
LILEDDGGDGTSGSHPEQTFFYPDVMVGFSDYDQRITELTFVAMLDSGWYNVDFRGATYLEYGIGPSFGSNHLINFFDLPPQKGFPDHYICKKDFEKSGCNWNYRGHGACSGNKVSCSSSSSKFCKSKEYYDPLDLGYESTLETDAAVVRRFSPEQYCGTNDYTYKSSSIGYSKIESRGKYSFCHLSLFDSGLCIKTQCLDDGTLKLFSTTGETAICKYEGQSVELNLMKVFCSNPIHICGIIHYETNFLNSTFDDLVYEILFPISPYYDDRNILEKALGYIPTIVIVGVVILLSIPLICCFFRKCTKSCKKRKKYASI